MSYWYILWSTGFSQLLLCLVLLLFGLESSESHRRVQLIRAELSSKSSSERLSESPSKLSSHQIPRCLESEGPLQLKGCTRTSSLFSPTTPSGASLLGAFFSHSALHFDFGVKQSCSSAARVLLASPSRASPSFASSHSAFLPYEAFPHAEERRPRIRASCGSALPSSGPTSSFLSSSMRMQYTCSGAVGRVFPTAIADVFQNRTAYFIALARLFRGAFFYRGGRTCFPGRDCVRLPVHCCIALFC